MRVHPFTAALAGVIGVFAVQTLWLGASARRVPLVVVVPLVALAVMQLLREGRGRHEPRDKGGRPQVLGAFAWAFALPGAIVALGLYIGPPLFVVAYQRWRGGESWVWSISFAVLVGLCVWLLFAVLLNQSVPLGLFGLLPDR